MDLTMYRLVFLAFAFLLFTPTVVEGKKANHQWSVGRILDENRARYFAGMLNNSSSQATENGT